MAGGRSTDHLSLSGSWHTLWSLHLRVGAKTAKVAIWYKFPPLRLRAIGSPPADRRRRLTTGNMIRNGDGVTKDRRYRPTLHPYAYSYGARGLAGKMPFGPP